MASETYMLAAVRDEADALDDLIRRAQAGEEAAFEEILGRFEGKALSIARNLGASREDAEDVAQDAFIKLFRHIGAYRGGRRFTTYFFRIVINSARDHLRRQGPVSGPPVSLEAGEAVRAEGDAAEAAASDRERRAQVRQALLLLSDREREVILLRDLHGLGTWEVARILRLNPITVRRHAMQARARLRKILGG